MVRDTLYWNLLESIGRSHVVSLEVRKKTGHFQNPFMDRGYQYHYKSQCLGTPTKAFVRPHSVKNSMVCTWFL